MHILEHFLFSWEHESFPLCDVSYTMRKRVRRRREKLSIWFKRGQEGATHPLSACRCSFFDVTVKEEPGREGAKRKGGLIRERGRRKVSYVRICSQFLPSTNWLEPSILCDCIGWWWQGSKMRYLWMVMYTLTVSSSSICCCFDWWYAASWFLWDSSCVCRCSGVCLTCMKMEVHVHVHVCYGVLHSVFTSHLQRF